ncbi:MAG: asparagine synthase (glutamine-hydrolyzing) [Candidatus Dormibacteraeota bacterium]|nr:asparagine synthase (glutamine-hydrolyzing) [Candidatus Dormibacteraeota bacterium]MBV9524681.1 asparagine synthase (glutamine-hydrolyzing) [Candidatus Dormibacteraeota bacterium]
MCGISGFWGPRDRALLEAMTQALVHRGPDDVGYLETDGASLGFRRLSILDLEHGNQPMSTNDGKVHLVFNGEVYNFRELRAELQPLGHGFHTTCDAEVVLHAYAEWGVDCFRRFNGMWGLAILDERGAYPRLVLARDHFGIKPLFYAQHGARVLFGSEIKAILQDASFPRAVDEQQMFEYLRHGLFDHNDATFFKGVRQVPAAAYTVIDGEGISDTKYWTPRLSEDGDPDPAAFRAVFERAVERRLVADVPVGICLSGGLDSSSICTVMARLLRDHAPDAVSLGDRLKTFSAFFPGDPIDESAYIQTVLETTGADSSVVEPTDQDFIRELEAWVWHMEEPMVSSAPFAMWMVMRLARRQVKVVLDGQAGDELLAGYDHYPYVFLRQLLRDRQYVRFAREAWLLRDIVTPLVKRRLWERRHRISLDSLLRPEFTAGRPAPHDDRVADDLKLRLLQDFVTYSLPPLLRYEDRASMAHSLEARLPFLDQELVDYVLSLPTRAIINNGWTRAVVRKALHGMLPEKVERRRKKIGFTTPEFRWYRRQRAVLQSLMRSPAFQHRPYWHGTAVAEAFARACRGEIEENMFFWRAINAEVWMRIFLDDRTTSLDEGSYRSGFVRRGDADVAAELGGGDEALAAARLNWGRHLFLQDGGAVWARFPLRSKLIQPGDELVPAIAEALVPLQEAGVEVEDGDLLLISEKTLAISQGRSYPIEDIHPTRLARTLSRFVSHEPTGVGLAHPTTMQLALEEAGAPRILVAAAAAAVTRPLGVRGVFYRIAGYGPKAIDGPSALNLPPYDRWATKAPLDPAGEARRIARDMSERTGRAVGVAIIDANDMAAEVFATSDGVSEADVLAVVRDNPLGQSDEQTPFGLVRRMRAAAVREPVLAPA